MDNFSPDATLTIAIYGAVLATISTILSVALGVNEFRKSKKQLKIICKYDRNPLSKDKYHEDNLDCLIVVVSNSGPRPITITSFQYKTSSGYFRDIKLNDRVNLANTLPKKLEYGDSFDMKFLLPDLKEMMLNDGSPIDPQASYREEKLAKIAAVDSENRRYVIGKLNGFRELYAKKNYDEV